MTTRRTAAWGRGAVATTMSDEGGGALGLLLGGAVGLRELDPREAVRERWQAPGPFEDLGLELESIAQAIHELVRQITVIDGPPDGRQIIGYGLEFAGVGRDGHVAAGRGAEGLAEKHVPGVLIVEEEAMEASPRSQGEAVGALDKTIEISGKGRHEPKAQVDVDGTPGGVRIGRRGPLSDMVEDLIHGHEKDKDLFPLREICPSRIHLIFDVIGDVYAENWVGGEEVGMWDRKNCGGLRAGDGHDRQRLRELTEIEWIGSLGSWGCSGHWLALLQGG